MSQESKEATQEATKFFKRVSEESQHLQRIIPDKQLGEKLRKVSEASEQVVKHIEEHSK